VESLERDSHRAHYIRQPIVREREFDESVLRLRRASRTRRGTFMNRFEDINPRSLKELWRRNGRTDYARTGDRDDDRIAEAGGSAPQAVPWDGDARCDARRARCRPRGGRGDRTPDGPRRRQGDSQARSGGPDSFGNVGPGRASRHREQSDAEIHEPRV
jgi:hypothetical protein